MAPAEGFVTPSARGPRRLPAEAKKFGPRSHRGSGLGVLRYFSARPGALQERARRQDPTSSRYGVFSLFLGRRVTYRAGDYLPPHYFLSLFPGHFVLPRSYAMGILGAEVPQDSGPLLCFSKYAAWPMCWQSPSRKASCGSCGRSSGERRTSRTEAWVQIPPSALASGTESTLTRAGGLWPLFCTRKICRPADTPAGRGP